MLNEKNYAWSTHQPLIRAAMELFKPRFVLELGIGNYSTPVFLEYPTVLKSIENNSDWIKEMKNKFPNIDVTYHNAGVTQSQPLRHASKQTQRSIKNYYLGLEIPEVSPKLLFVDQFSACRTISINAIGNKFDIIIFHDTHCREYRYDKINISGYERFELITEKSNASIMIKNGIDLSVFKSIVKKQIERYKKENPECKIMKLA